MWEEEGNGQERWGKTPWRVETKNAWLLGTPIKQEEILKAKEELKAWIP